MPVDWSIITKIIIIDRNTDVTLHVIRATNEESFKTIIENITISNLGGLENSVSKSFTVTGINIYNENKQKTLRIEKNRTYSASLNNKTVIIQFNSAPTTPSRWKTGMLQLNKGPQQVRKEPYKGYLVGGRRKQRKTKRSKKFRKTKKSRRHH